MAVFFLLIPLEPGSQPRADHVSRMPSRTTNYLRIGFPVCVVRSIQVSDTPFSLTCADCMMFSTRRSSKFSLPKMPAIAHFSGQPFLTSLVLYLKTFQLVPNYPLPDPDSSCVISSESASCPDLCCTVRKASLRHPLWGSLSHPLPSSGSLIQVAVIY
jgi:hypothetical protein